MHSYHLYGTQVLSGEKLLLELPAGDPAGQQVELLPGAPAQQSGPGMSCVASRRTHGRQIRLLTDGELDRPEPGQARCFEVSDVVRFQWLAGHSAVHWELLGEGNSRLLTFWFVHLLLPLFLSLERWYDVLHAGAIELGGKPVLFIAPSMGGKSTLTGHFVQRGHPLISDDKVPGVVEGARFLVGGSHPYHRRARRDEELGCRAEHFTSGFKPLHTLYLLQRSAPDCPVSIEEIVGFRKFGALLPNQLFTLGTYRERQLQSLAVMLNESRMFQVSLPWTRARLPEVYETIGSHQSRLS